MPSAMVTFNGRITLPPNVRKELGLRTGDSVEFVEMGNGRYAIAPRIQAGATHESDADGDHTGWVPDLNFASTEEEPRFKEMDELIF